MTKKQKKTEKQVPTVPVSLRAIEQRIQRALQKDYPFAKLHRARTERARLDLGDFYAVDAASNLLIARGINLEPYARELGVLEPWEYFDDEKGESK